MKKPAVHTLMIPKYAVRAVNAERTVEAYQYFRTVAEMADWITANKSRYKVFYRYSLKSTPI